jgi:hypothetical protein
MAVKRVLRADRLRRVPSQFSWIDQRLVRDRHLERCGLDAIGLYLVLVTLADAHGLSYYGEASLERLLSMPAPRLTAVGNTRWRLSFFVMVQCYSRQMYVEFTVSQTMEHFLGCHERAFAALGVPDKVMVDNLRSNRSFWTGGCSPSRPRYRSSISSLKVSACCTVSMTKRPRTLQSRLQGLLYFAASFIKRANFRF